jgi:hypothetical protein
MAMLFQIFLAVARAGAKRERIPDTARAAPGLVLLTGLFDRHFPLLYDIEEAHGSPQARRANRGRRAAIGPLSHAGHLRGQVGEPRAAGRFTGAETPGSGHFSNISSPDYIRAAPTVDLPADELAAVTAAIRRAIADDKFPTPRALIPWARRWRGSTRRLSHKWQPWTKRDPAPTDRKSNAQNERLIAPKAAPRPKAPPPAKADKRARR